MFMSSCATSLYQVVETAPNEELTRDLNPENPKIDISYNLWANEGKLELKIQNNTAEPIYIDWLQSSLIINDRSYTLYQPTTFETTSSTVVTPIIDAYSTKKSKGFSKTMSQTINQVDIIPPYANINKVYFNGELGQKYIDCELKLEKEDIDKIVFDEINTPVNYKIMLAYCEDMECNTPTFTFTGFNIEAIYLMTSAEFTGKAEKVKDCNNKITYVSPMPYKKDSNFYFATNSTSSNGDKKGGAGGFLIGIVAIAVVTALILNAN